ncbi:MAG TPA: alpha/beta fold hydrolase [Actinomycetota bacterium]|nr:alpha/beta fold hydrolase [Actinomycetota bacterium]
MTESTTVTSKDGLHLEAELDAPKEPVGSITVCHPHPQMGGTMNAPLLLALRDALVESGRAVLRFNFRGIGASDGEASTGAAEVADALGALEYAKERFPSLAHGLLGWSFGGAVAVRAATRASDLSACTAIAPSVEAKEGVSDGLPPPEDLRVTVPLLIICGRNDEVVPPDACRAWAEAVGASYREVPGANHFFWARYNELCDLVVTFLEEEMG